MSTTGPYQGSLPAPGSTIDANWGAQVVRAINFMQGLPLSGDGERCQAFIYQTVAQSLTNATVTPVLFDAELLDVGVPGHSTTTNTSRWTNNTGLNGWFDVMANCVWVSNATGYRQMALRTNGSGTLAISQTQAVSGNTTSMSIAQKVFMFAGDFIDLAIFQNSGGALNTSPSLPINIAITQSRMQ